MYADFHEKATKAILNALNAYTRAQIEYLVTDNMITMQGDDIVRYKEKERLN